MRFFLAIVTIFISFCVEAQIVRGRVIVSKQYTPINDVLVANKRTGDAVYTDSAGRFAITAIEGDMLYFYRIGYEPHNQQVHIERGEITTVVLKMADLTLEEVQIKGSTYQQDSAWRANTYKKTINDANQKVKTQLGFGIAFDGLIGKAASRLTGREKRIQRFKKAFISGEEQKFIATKYTPARVSRLTGLEGDAINQFIYTYPMPYDFARAASELELNMWIWNNYKQYRNKPKDKQ